MTWIETHAVSGIEKLGHGLTNAIGIAVKSFHLWALAKHDLPIL
jgi:hypothetical protein